MTTDQHSPDELSRFAELMRNEEEFPGIADRIDPAVRRRRRRRALIITIVVIALILCAVGGYTGWALSAPVAAPAAVSAAPHVAAPAAATVSLPSSGASAISVSGADAYLGPTASGIWATSGSNDPRPIASISKLITALVILDAHPLADASDPGPTITFDKADHDLYDKYYVMGATIAAMPTGSTMSLHDALATMLIPSASNYAEAVSTWAFGSQGAFLGAARAWLAANGLSGTTIVEPTGISSRNTSTPTDLIALGKLALAHPAIAQIVATPSLTLPGPGAMHNTNGLLGTDGITGLKTGNLGENSYNLLYSASLEVGAGEPLTVVGVVLGGATRETVNADVVRTLDSVRSGFHEVPVVAQGLEVGSYSTPWGSTARIVVAEDASIFTWSDTPITVAIQTTTPKLYEDGEQVGTLTWTAGPQTATARLEIDGDISPPTEWWRLTHPSELGAG
ncbi:D-alanyl-D-alanine carboxypeptidase family protein [Microbacterium timonense]|uniref:D-alanyl-D-alanine carboxypeptidase family protein n=1 Tax=Microbacterium timonense TaxID=2086576 RepID=UPI001F2443AF|nr:D-alanyl-D-alanine carboxypeptidase [Microbacterium timonense]